MLELKRITETVHQNSNQIMYGGKENNAFEEALQTRKVHGFEKGHDFHGRAYGGDVYALGRAPA